MSTQPDFDEHDSEAIPLHLKLEPGLEEFYKQNISARRRLRLQVENLGNKQDAMNIHMEQMDEGQLYMIKLLKLLMDERKADKEERKSDREELKKNTEITQEVRNWLQYGKVGGTIATWIIRNWPGLAALAGSVYIWWHGGPK